jgi:hypothetical protein
VNGGGSFFRSKVDTIRPETRVFRARVAPTYCRTMILRAWHGPFTDSRVKPSRLVLAVPVAPGDSLANLSSETDEIVCLATPDPFFTVGMLGTSAGRRMRKWSICCAVPRVTANTGSRERAQMVELAT